MAFNQRTDPRTGQQHWIKFYFGDWISETMHLSVENERHLFRLGMAVVAAQGPIPDSAKECAHILGRTVRQWKRIRRDLIEARVITIVDGYIHHRQAEKWIAVYQKRSRQNAENARRQWGNGIQEASE